MKGFLKTLLNPTLADAGIDKNLADRKLEGEIWQRVALDFSVVMPIGGLPMPIEDLRNVRVVRAPGVIQDVVQ